MKLTDLKRIVDLLVQEGCGECSFIVDICGYINFERSPTSGKIMWADIDTEGDFSFGVSGETDIPNTTGNITNPAGRAKLVSFLKENFK